MGPDLPGYAYRVKNTFNQYTVRGLQIFSSCVTAEIR